MSAREAVAKDLVELVGKIEHSVVRIDTDLGQGSGVVIDDRGVVLTNFHVVEGATKAMVSLRDGKLMKVSGYLVADSLHDLAVLKVDAFDKPRAIKLAADLPRIGQEVAAFGSPRGLSFSTSDGIVSAIRTGNEIVESLGREFYSRLGYTLDARWIQTTAPISPGNSGGPLVTMGAELVGLNTWHRPDGQNLNFAISIVDIHALLKTTKPDEPPKPLASLKRKRGRALPSAPSGKPNIADARIELPTGRVFSYGIFDANPNIIEQAAEADQAGVVLIHHSNGILYALVQQRNGSMHGLTLGQYENKQRMVYASYDNGRRHGVLMTWGEDGRPRLWGQYNNGKRHGFLCWHEDEKLSLLMQFKADQIEWIQLMDDLEPLEGFKTREEADRHDLAKPRLARFDEFESNLKKNEVVFRKQVKEFEMGRRRALAAQLAPEKRRLQSARGAARAAAENAALSEMYHRAWGGR